MVSLMTWLGACRVDQAVDNLFFSVRVGVAVSPIGCGSQPPIASILYATSTTPAFPVIGCLTAGFEEKRGWRAGHVLGRRRVHERLLDQALNDVGHVVEAVQP